MRNHVTVIPNDKIIIVDRQPLLFGFPAPSNMHALQWHNNGGHIEWTDDSNHLLFIRDYEDKVKPFVTLWQAEKNRIDKDIACHPSESKIAEDARVQRNNLIASTDFLLMPDYPLSDESRALIYEYRQYLRDIPEQDGFPYNIIWPQFPSI